VGDDFNFRLPSLSFLLENHILIRWFLDQRGLFFDALSLKLVASSYLYVKSGNRALLPRAEHCKKE